MKGQEQRRRQGGGEGSKKTPPITGSSTGCQMVRRVLEFNIHYPRSQLPEALHEVNLNDSRKHFLKQMSNHENEELSASQPPECVMLCRSILSPAASLSIPGFCFMARPRISK